MGVVIGLSRGRSTGCVHTSSDARQRRNQIVLVLRPRPAQGRSGKRGALHHEGVAKAEGREQKNGLAKVFSLGPCAGLGKAGNEAAHLASPLTAVS